MRDWRGGGLVEAGVDAAVGAGVDGEDATRARKTIAKTVARLGRASPALPRESTAWPTSTARFGRARPAVPRESQALPRMRWSMPTASRAIVLRLTEILFKNPWRYPMPPCTASAALLGRARPTMPM